MSQEAELHRLELIVEKLLANFTELKAENGRLQDTIKDKNQQLEDLRAELSTQKSERGEISKRVTSLVSQIEDWEKTLDIEAEGALGGSNDGQGPVSEIEAEEEEDPEPAASSKGGEEEKRQHNLFSISGMNR